MEMTFPKIETKMGQQMPTKSFSIGDARVIIDILRSKMYSHPITTLVQEVMSNARDANAEVGKSDLPIEVTLPTYTNLVLMIKDFGPGISPDRMANVFIQYGNSTKRDDNGQVGGFGLGAKSPFAYVDQFLISTNTMQDNKVTKRQYAAFIDDTRMGSISLVSEEETTEDTGTTIIVSVKKADVNAFEVAVKKICQYWPIRPSITNKGFSWPEEAPIVQGKNWKIFPCVYYGTDKGLFVTLAGIPYSVKSDKLPGWNTKFTKFHNYKTVLHFNTGDLMVTANREELDYQDSNAHKTIEARLSEVLKEIEIRLNAELAKATRYFEAVAILQQSPLSEIASSPKWNGKDVERSIYGKLPQLERTKNGDFKKKKPDHLHNVQMTDLFIFLDSANQLGRKAVKEWIAKNPTGRIFVTTNIDYKDYADFVVPQGKPVAPRAKRAPKETFKCIEITETTEEEKSVDKTSTGISIIRQKGSYTFSTEINNRTRYVDVSELRKVMKIIGVDKVYAIANSNNPPPNLTGINFKVIEKMKSMLKKKSLMKMATSSSWGRYYVTQEFKDAAKMVFDQDSLFVKYVTDNSHEKEEAASKDLIELYENFTTLKNLVSYRVYENKDRLLKAFQLKYPLLASRSDSYKAVDIAAYANFINTTREFKKLN